MLSYRHFLSNGHPLVPCCPDKEGSTVPLKSLLPSQSILSINVAIVLLLRYSTVRLSSLCKTVCHKATDLQIKNSIKDKFEPRLFSLMPMVNNELH